MLTVSVVIPNWNGVYLLKKHLHVVIDAAPVAEIVVADDASTDGSVEYLRKNFPRVRVVARQTHTGFASNVNAGVQQSHGDIVILLNTDVEPDRNFLKPLISHFQDPEVFAVGCLEKSVEAGETILRGRGIARWHKGYYVHSRGEVNKTDTAWVSGGSSAFRRSMWDKLGGLDELYNPFYWEDIDFSYRARKVGWKTLFEAKSVVHHYHEEGKIKREFSPWDVQRIVYRNQFIFIWKNCTDISLLLSHILWTPVRIIQALMSGDVLMIQGFFLALARLSPIIKRRVIQRSFMKESDTSLTILT